MEYKFPEGTLWEWRDVVQRILGKGDSLSPRQIIQRIWGEDIRYVFLFKKRKIKKMKAIAVFENKGGTYEGEY